MTIRDIEVQGRKVQLYEAGSGAPVLYFHGVADMHGAAAEPFPFHRALADKFKLIAPAHPGCVGSAEDNTLESIDDLVFHALELLDTLGLERADIVGNGMGGWLAAELAARNPERVGKLALIGATGLFVSGSPIGDLFMAVQPQNGGVGDLRSMLFSDGDGELAQTMFPDILADKPQGMRRYQVFRFASRVGFTPPYFYHAKLRDRLHRFKGPALVVWGNNDRFVPVSHAKAYGEALAGSTVELISGAGHAVILESPDVVAGKIAAFMAG
ncbi:MAG: alpha/beta fold hydrolase [Proteobacteria bacterium]|nr:alpha/beta fold hydrolase [Pseudomonadota bacterium]